MAHPRFFEKLYFQVLVGIALGVGVGYFFPGTGENLKPLGDGFIRLIKMLITPIIFSTVVLGIAKMKDMKEVGRVGIKALLYFEIVSAIALVVGLLTVNLLKPGAGLNADLSTLNTGALSTYTESAKAFSTTDFILNIIPNNIVEAFARGEILQVLLFSILFGFALARMGDQAKSFVTGLELFSKAFFTIIHMIMKLAPIGAFGAMAFTIAKFGLGTLFSLGALMLSVYGACIFFVLVILGFIARLSGFSILKLLYYIRDEILIVLGTSSSESVLPRIIEKMESIGCGRSVVGLVIPTGYSFNLDGTSIYLTAAVLFIAQATNTPMTLGDQLTTLGILLITSKGAAGVTGSGFVTLAATLASLHTVPVAGIALLIGIDRFMSEARAITNLIGNSVATVVISKWEGELDPLLAKPILFK
ncbi:MAG: C4-dicarboxylate transporter [Bacteriovoracaceae bacterium]|nr:C4-dicarboxylate transporter [Bacteriovoracaceae bacterium]